MSSDESHIARDHVARFAEDIARIYRDLGDTKVAAAYAEAYDEVARVILGTAKSTGK